MVNQYRQNIDNDYHFPKKAVINKELGNTLL